MKGSIVTRFFKNYRVIQTLISNDGKSLSNLVLYIVLRKFQSSGCASHNV